MESAEALVEEDGEGRWEEQKEEEKKEWEDQSRGAVRRSCIVSEILGRSRRGEERRRERGRIFSTLRSVHEVGEGNLLETRCSLDGGCRIFLHTPFLK